MPHTRSIAGLFFALLALVLLVASAAATATISVAAADAPEEVRASADFICDGVDDQLEINGAFDALPWDGGTVRLSTGTFRCTDNLVPGAYTTLEGAGTSGTTIAISGYYHAIKIDRPHVTIRAIRITDRAWVRITANHVRLEDVLAEDDLHGYYPGKPQDMGANGAFFVWAENRVVEDIVFYRCEARDIGTHGFNMNGAGSPRMTRDIRFVECRAIRCGDADGHPWATGFDFHEENDLVDLTVERCYAADNWESGFHFEPGYRQEEITLVDCVSEENGWRNTNLGDFTVRPAVPAHFYMAGYTFAKGTHLVNCRSVHNRNYGFYDEQNGNNVLERCIDIESGYGYKFCKNVQGVALVDCVSVDPANWAIWAAWTNNLRVEGFHQYNAPGRADVSPRVQSMLGWYKGEPTYEKPVVNSHFEITAHGSTLPILNNGDIYNPAGSGNTYDLAPADGSYVDPVQTPIPVGTSPPTPSYTPVPEATPPIPAVHTIPGRIEAENYLPGRGTGFSDTTAGNEGAIYRFDDVDIEYTAAIAGYDIGYIRLGEWLAYNLDAASGGPYAAAFRLACPYDGRSFQVEVDGIAVGRITVPKTAGFEAYSTAELPFDLAPGRHRLVVRFDQTQNANLDRVDVRLLAAGTITATPTVTVTPTVNETATPAANVTPPPPIVNETVTVTPTVNITPPPPIVDETITVTPTANVTATPTVNETVTVTLTVNVTETPTDTETVAITPTVTITETPTVHDTVTMTPIAIVTVTPTVNETATPPVTPDGLRAFPGAPGLPTDPDGDGLYEDINGNGRTDFADVVLLFNSLEWLAANEPVGLFDANGNGRVDFADVTALFERL